MIPFIFYGLYLLGTQGGGAKVQFNCDRLARCLIKIQQRSIFTLCDTFGIWVLKTFTGRFGHFSYIVTGVLDGGTM